MKIGTIYTLPFLIRKRLRKDEHLLHFLDLRKALDILLNLMISKENRKLQLLP